MVGVQDAYSSSGKKLTVQVFAPGKPGRYPVVVALHGSGGVGQRSYLDYAQMLANQGFLVLVPHYFEASDTVWADEAAIARNFAAWMKAVSDCIDWAGVHPQADSRVGIIGFSLGAYLALALASEQPRISAVVDYFGGMPQHFAQKLDKMCPVLILHGDADTSVPVAEAQMLEAVLSEKLSPYEIKIYRGAGHGFSGLDMLDAGRRTYFFLKQHLG